MSLIEELWSTDAREKFEAHVLAVTGRDMAYHTTYGTTGIVFGWSCYIAGLRDACDVKQKGVCGKDSQPRMQNERNR